LKLKLFIVGSAGVPARYGGFETFAENVSLRLSQDFNIYITCSSKFYTYENRQKNWNNLTRIFIPVRANGYQSLIYDFISLAIAHSQADFIIMLGSGSGLMLPFFKILKKLPVAVHIDGIEWKREKWNYFARTFLWLNYRFCLKFSHYIIVDNKALIKNIPGKYLSKVINISYGCEHLPEVKINPTFSGLSYALVIARAEPENNLEMIINAFISISYLNLIIISNWKYTKYGRWLFRNTKNITNVQMISPIYDDKELLQQYRMGCSVYIHGHSAGGTNPSLIEAMSTGKPILVFDNDFNRVTTSNMAYYFNNTLTLRLHLNMIKEEKYLLSGQNLKVFARHEYSWNKVSQKILSLIGQ